MTRILSLFPFQIVLWTFYQYEAIVTQYIRLVIRVIKRWNHYAYLGGHYFIISFWLTPLPGLLITTPQNGPNHHPSRLSTEVLIPAFPP